MEPILVRSDSWEELVPSAVQEHSYDNLLDTPGFRSGLSNERHLAGAFEYAAKDGLLTGIRFIAKRVNPHRYTAMLCHVFTCLKDCQPVLNRNCTYCSKAVDINLEAMVAMNFDQFYVAEEIEGGGHNQYVSNMKNEMINISDSLSDLLIARIQEGMRAIIVVPIKGKSYAHSMNFVSYREGHVVIDGQNRKIYDLHNPRHKRVFDTKYGVSSTNIHNVVTIYPTGVSPQEGI